jgi:AcrR family transcriptional regulator
MTKRTRATRTTASTTKKPMDPGSGERGEDLRSVLLNSALVAFANAGFEAMSVRELTRSLDVSHNIVHHHFKSKRDLWREALEYGMADARREIVGLYENAAVDADADPADAIRGMVRSAVHLFARYPSLARIIANESALGGERLDYLFKHYIEPTERALTRFLKSIHKRRGLRKIDHGVVTLYLISGVASLFTYSALAKRVGNLDSESKADVAAYADAVAELIAGGLVESL